MTARSGLEGTLASWMMALPLRGLIRLYQLLLSPLLPGACRYHPTCSAYAGEAVRLHGPIRGGLMAVGRLLRCHPLGGFGIDPVPERRERFARGTSPRDPDRGDVSNILSSEDSRPYDRPEP
jgi:putative membrane protein insertion efficiency factor